MSRIRCVYAEAKRGASLVLGLTITDKQGNAIDLVDVTEIRFQARKKYGSTAVIDESLTGGGIVIASPTTETSTSELLSDSFTIARVLAGYVNDRESKADADIAHVLTMDESAHSEQHRQAANFLGR